jgi:diguanylate cyclase (GGDEF)-like protein
VSVGLIAGAVLVVGLVASLWFATTGREARYHRFLLAGPLAIAGAALSAAALDLAPGPVGPGWGSLVFAVGAGMGCVLVYYGLLCWMQVRTGVQASSETLVTLGAVLVLMAIGNLVADRMLTDCSGLRFWQLQANLLVFAATIIALGTALWITPLTGLLRDRRMWLSLLALTGFVGPASAGLLVPGEPPPVLRLVWLAAAAVLVLARRAPVTTDAGPGVPLTQSSIFGSLLVILAGIVTLGVQVAMPGKAGPTVLVLVSGGVLLVSRRMIGVVAQLTQLTRTRREALTDELTGVANRRSLLAEVETVVAERRPSALMIIDLDRFKEVNDRYGHLAGDQVLRHVSAAFARELPPRALLARLGGDEFAVLAEDLSLVSAVGLAKRLVSAMGPLEDEGRVLEVGASIGVAVLDSATRVGSDLLRRADVAMYQAKSSGSGVHAYDRAFDTAAQQRRALIEDLQEALFRKDSGQVVVHFQPQVDVHTGVVAGAEALVRWQHPRLGLLAPDRFLTLVEDNGLMPRLTLRVMELVALHSAHWRESGHDLRVSLNLSATCLAEPMLLPSIDEVLLGSGIRPQALLLEVTETSLMTNPDEALATMRSITGRGVGLSIDDYGTGYSSLSYMNVLPASELKIDRSFTARLGHDPRTAAIVAGTAELAHRLGMRLVAEGTEDEDALRRVRELGCDLSQGYLHSRPLAPDTFRQWLAGQVTVREGVF